MKQFQSCPLVQGLTQPSLVLLVIEWGKNHKLNLLFFTTSGSQSLKKKVLWSSTPAQIYVLVRGSLLYANTSFLIVKLWLALSVFNHSLLVRTSLSESYIKPQRASEGVWMPHTDEKWMSSLERRHLFYSSSIFKTGDNAAVSLGRMTYARLNGRDVQ